MLEDIRFENPDLLHLLWALPLQAFLLWVYWGWRRRTLRRLGSKALEQRLLQGFSERRFWFKNLLYAAGLALIALSIASPVRFVKEQSGKRYSADVLIALDISNSMLAKDVSPSRLEQAKTFIQKLVQALEGERIGLIFFAGDAYPQMPLSLDYEALLMFVRNAQPDFITDQGTDIAAAVELAGRMLETGTETGKALILISDGENHEENALQRVQEARKKGILLFTVGAGTEGGAMIPAGGKAYRRDFTGQPVRTSANESLMASLAKAGGGQALNLREEAQAAGAIKTAVSRLQKSAVEASASSKKVYYFPWLLLAALCFLVLEQLLWWRKGVPKTALSLALFIAATPCLHAQADHRALLRGDQFYDQGDYEKALTAYRVANTGIGKYNAGNAAYKQGRYAEAAGLYREAADKSTTFAARADALYNLGNAYLMQGQYAEAIEAYERSLRIAPNRFDAKKNLQIAKRKQQEPPPVQPPPPPPPPPPPSLKPQPRYLDQASPSRQKEIPPVNLPKETALRMLEEAVLPEEQKNARAYRELSPARRPSRTKKDW